jgi:hypothetical protein
MEDFLAGAVQSTFSIAVAVYLLVRMENRLEGLTSAIARLQTAIDDFFRREGDRNAQN